MSPGFETMTWDEVKTELDKCTIMCYSCHRLEHYKRRELKEFLPYLTKEQRQELEADIIHDAELISILNDDEAIRDSLTIVEEPTDISLAFQQHQDKIEQLLLPEEHKCLYCGSSFDQGTDNYFCSDYCKEQAQEEALEANKLKILQEITSVGIQNTCSRHGWKLNKLRRKVPFLIVP